jgi:AcrR family transcriptional regulator
MTGKRASPGRPRDPLADSAILGAALELFIERGIDGVSFEEIARRAGVTRPTIYRRWPTKEQILARAIEAVRERAAPSNERLKEMLQSFAPRDFTRLFLETGVELWADKELRQLIFRLIGAKATSPALLATYWKSYGGPRWELFLAFLERMRVDGLLPESTDVEMLGNMIAGAMIFRLFFVPSRDELSRRSIRAYLERLMHQAGLAGRRRPQRK